MTTLVNLARGATCDVYIGRPGPFGNPSVIHGGACPVCSRRHTDRGDTIDCYRVWFHGRIARDPDFRAAIQALKGQRLGCYCVPERCHGEVIVEYLESSGRPETDVLAAMFDRESRERRP